MNNTLHMIGKIIRILLIVIINVIVYFSIEDYSIFLIILSISIMLIGLTIFLIIYEDRIKDALVKEITYKVEEQGENIFLNLPIGILVTSTQGIIRWTNPYLSSLFEDELINSHVEERFENILTRLENEEYVIIELNYEYYHVVKSGDALYFFNDTEHKNIIDAYNNEKLVIGFVNLDNYDEYTLSLDEERTNKVLSNITKELNQWGLVHGIYFKKYSRNRYIMILDNEKLSHMIADDFSLLEKIRTYGREQDLPLTVSMSFSQEGANVVDLAENASEGLEFVLSRGGDQVVVKTASGKSEFYGGLTDAVAKRSRSNVRMVSQSIANIIKKSSNVIIMGHKHPDFDSIGACVGISKFAKSLSDDVKVVLNMDRIPDSTMRLLKFLEDSEFSNMITSENKALASLNKETIVIVVDTHRNSLVESERIVENSKNIIVIDHHRRSEDVIQKILVGFIEPYASSTSELVSEILNFQKQQVSLSPDEATAMLSGIIVDTKQFVYRTSKRTFEAAAELNDLGADTIAIQDLLKEEIEKVQIKNRMIANLKLVNKSCAITVCDMEMEVSQELLAQTADEILSIRNVKASFVIGNVDGMISISSRSLGEINVQLIMEKLGGGGHMTAAAVKLNDVEIDEVLNNLETIIMGGNLDESNIS